eukprot:448552_1
MGNYIISRYQYKVSGYQKHVLVSGLPDAGKSSIIYRMKMGKTVGVDEDRMEIETLETDYLLYVIFDSANSINGMQTNSGWNKYYENTKAFIWVVDSTDRATIQNSATMLHYMLSQQQMRNVLVLIFGNKQDISWHHPMQVKELTEKLELGKLKQEWVLQLCDMPCANGLSEGFHWIKYKLNTKPTRWLATPDYEIEEANIPQYPAWISSKMYNRIKKSNLLISGWIKQLQFNSALLQIPNVVQQIIHAFYIDQN